MTAKIGRPTIYSEELALKICKRIADGESLRSICRDDDMPERTTVLGWSLDLSHPFSSKYMHARDLQADAMADELNDISDDGSNDWMERKMRNGETELVTNHEHINRSRLRVDTRKWIAAKLKPKRYGDKQVIEHEGKISLESIIAGSTQSSVQKEE